MTIDAYVGPFSDIWALGVIAHELFTGHKPVYKNKELRVSDMLIQ